MPPISFKDYSSLMRKTLMLYNDKEVNNGDMSDDIRSNNNALTLAQELKCFI